MTALVDTNVLVRHLVGDPPAQAKRATRFLGTYDRLILTDVVLAEVVYVLESFYEWPPSDISHAARTLLALPSLAAADIVLLLRALDLYERHGLAFADAHLAATAELWGVGKVASFDRGLDRIKSVRRIDP